MTKLSEMTDAELLELQKRLQDDLREINEEQNWIAGKISHIDFEFVRRRTEAKREGKE